MDMSTGPLQVPIVLPHRRRDPFEVIFSAVFAASGVGQLLVGARPGSVQELLPGWFSFMWLVMVTLGSLGVLAGVYWRDQVNGLFIESVSLLAVAVSVCFYGVGIIVVGIEYGHVAGGLFSGPLTIALGFAFWWKRHQVLATIRELPTK